MSELEYELSLALRLAIAQPDDQATLGFAGAVKSLSWSDPTLTRLVRAKAAEAEQHVARSIPDVCADMKAWVASGYTTLPPTTRELQAKQDEEAKEAAGTRATRSVASLLVRYEGPPEKAIIRRIKALGLETANALKGLDGVYRQLDRTLGLTLFEEEPSNGPPAGSVVIGHGRTAVGGKYTVRLEPKQPASGHGEPHCDLSVSITDARGRGAGGGMCLSTSHIAAESSVNCNEGLLTIEAQTLPAARSVSLLLSDGRHIASRPVIVPARLGGPAGFYYQVVRGPSPIPVSLTEFDAHGRKLRVLKLYRIVECTKHPLKFLRGGIRTIAHGRVPQGPAFSIVGEAYRFLGHIHFAMKIEIEHGGSGESFRGEKPSLFGWELQTGCQPHEYAIVYGLLKAPHDTVLARTSGKTSPFHRVPIPKSLHAGGALVYIVLPAPPGELVVRAPSGKAVLTEKLGSLATEASETCRGESEGA